MSTARCQLHGTGRDALTAAAHARLLAAKQHLDSRSSVRCSPPPRPCEPHAPLPFRPRLTPPGATRCPDAHRHDISGCGGGTAACREGRGLSGVYCTQCPEKQARQPAAAVLLRAAPCSPREPRPIAMLEATRQSPLSATSQYVDPLRGACASCDDVEWSPFLFVLLATLALALAARRLVASSPPAVRAADRALRRVPLWMRPGLPHWMGTFQSVVYSKIVWYATHAPKRSPHPEIIWPARSLHTHPRAAAHAPSHSPTPSFDPPTSRPPTPAGRLFRSRAPSTPYTA